ncbi:MAG: hypothetical protein GC178_17300 [Flavobacteriales bacterium]|nr:hypothetical protein [Flavobacteriales bacterium]
MRSLIIVLLISVAFFSCKNNGQSTSSATQKQAEAAETQKVKDIIVSRERKPREQDFQVLSMNCSKNVLTVIFRYSGGCKEHDFNAYFSGSFMKSLPPQAYIDFEHFNPDNDPCRSLVKDTVNFNLEPMRYQSGNEVIITWIGDPNITATYTY